MDWFLRSVSHLTLLFRVCQETAETAGPHSGLSSLSDESERNENGNKRSQHKTHRELYMYTDLVETGRRLGDNRISAGRAPVLYELKKPKISCQLRQSHCFHGEQWCPKLIWTFLLSIDACGAGGVLDWKFYPVPNFLEKNDCSILESL